MMFQYAGQILQRGGRQTVRFLGVHNVPEILMMNESCKHLDTAKRSSKQDETSEGSSASAKGYSKYLQTVELLLTVPSCFASQGALRSTETMFDSSTLE